MGSSDSLGYGWLKGRRDMPHFTTSRLFTSREMAPVLDYECVSTDEFRQI